MASKAVLGIGLTRPYAGVIINPSLHLLFMGSNPTMVVLKRMVWMMPKAILNASYFLCQHQTKNEM